MSRHVVVAGAGVVGLFAALYARDAGFEVTVVERLGPQRATASYGNAGLIVPSHLVPLAAPGAVVRGLRWMTDPESPFALRLEPDPELLAWGWHFWRASTRARARAAGPLLRDLHRAGKRAYQELEARLGADAFGLRGGGVLMLCVSEEGLEEEAALAARATALGVPARLLGPSEVAVLQPGLSLDVVGGVHYPEDAMLDPGRLMAALQAELERIGVQFRWGAHVEGAERSGDRIEALRLRRQPGIDADTADATRLPLDELVLAAGVASAPLARALGLRLPLRAGKGYSVTLADPPERPALPMLLSEGRVAVTPLPDGVRVGGTLELGAADTTVNGRRVRGLLRSLERALPAYSAERLASAPVWTGLRPVSPDGLPYLGRSATSANLVVATGHAMMGVSLAPVTGALVAELLEGRAPSLPLEALRPDRYA